MKFTEALERLRFIAEALPDDDVDKAEMLNTEGDYEQLMTWALKKRSEYMAYADANKALVEQYKKRQDSFNKRADDMKDVIRMIMDSAGERKFAGIATVAIKNVPPKPIVQDEMLVPDNYKITTVRIDKAAINKDMKEGIEISGVTMDNGGETLMIRN